VQPGPEERRGEGSRWGGSPAEFFLSERIAVSAGGGTLREEGIGKNPKNKRLERLSSGQGRSNLKKAWLTGMKRKNLGRRAVRLLETPSSWRVVGRMGGKSV